MLSPPACENLYAQIIFLALSWPLFGSVLTPFFLSNVARDLASFIQLPLWPINFVARLNDALHCHKDTLVQIWRNNRNNYILLTPSYRVLFFYFVQLVFINLALCCYSRNLYFPSTRTFFSHLFFSSVADFVPSHQYQWISFYYACSRGTPTRNRP